MKAHLAATALCALLVALPAAAQQEQPRSTTPWRAEQNPTSNPMVDPHKDGGRPESHGGTVHAPQINAAAPLPADLKPTAERASPATRSLRSNTATWPPSATRAAQCTTSATGWCSRTAGSAGP
ncbi:hypothetical protein [Microvirga sp. CF3016]|uniref:hypothetical protein n=1 Tax=Microvirga sp. CF3016 TaxID=3110181 RepID=UPI002E79C0C1|nr:hypothetical protein [Microvirga sp. CF3016]MEE1609864.1 hypothetical protein [Microvirga sp. CF3016]